MSISKRFAAAAIVIGGLGMASGVHAGSNNIEIEQQTTGVDRGPTDFKIDPRTSKASTCEGDISCGATGFVCESIGGQFNSHQNNEEGHNHAHGICTWPWE